MAIVFKLLISFD